MKAAETGVCDVEGNCLCSGEREDPEQIFENDDDDDNNGENDVGVGIFNNLTFKTYLYDLLPGVAELLEKCNFPAAQQIILSPI